MHRIDKLFKETRGLKANNLTIKNRDNISAEELRSHFENSTIANDYILEARYNGNWIEIQLERKA